MIKFKDVVKSSDTIIFYVSSSSGSDSNDGLSPEKPKKSLEVLHKGLKDGFPHWVLLKRGDYWNSNNYNPRAGRSETEPAVISSYGDASDPKPRINGRLLLWRGNVIVNDVELYRDDSVESVFSIMGQPNVGVENCSFYKTAIICYVSNFQLLNSCFYGNYNNKGGHAQNIFVTNGKNIVIENNVFDHGGWDDVISGAQPTIYNHNVYIQFGCKDVIFRNNISARPSSHGLQMRSGGVVSNNLFLMCPLGVLFGGGYPTPEDEGIHGIVENNTVMYVAHIGRPQTTGSIRGTGIEFNNLSRVNHTFCMNNIVAHYGPASPNSSNAFGILADNKSENNYKGINHLTIANNIVRDRGIALNLWGNYKDVTVRNNVFESTGIYSSTKITNINSPELLMYNNTFASEKENIKFTDFVEPTRNIETYMQYIGHPVEEQTLDYFMECARKMNDSRYTAVAVNEYMRQGFTKDPNKYKLNNLINDMEDVIEDYK